MLPDAVIGNVLCVQKYRPLKLRPVYVKILYDAIFLSFFCLTLLFKNFKKEVVIAEHFLYGL